MTRFLAAAAAAAALLVANGVGHGMWSHRWVGWDHPSSQAAAARLEAVPTAAGTWTGQRIETDPLSLPEEITGRGVSVRFTDATDQAVVYAYIACGPTDAMIAHVPTVCYPANGYTWCPPDIRVDPTTGTDTAAGPRFWVSGFRRGDGVVATNLRVFWAFSDGNGWRVPANPGREFRQSSVLFKCYLTREVSAADEPLGGEPCGRLWAALQPELDRVLFGPR